MKRKAEGHVDVWRAPVAQTTRTRRRRSSAGPAPVREYVPPRKGQILRVVRGGGNLLDPVRQGQQRDELNGWADELAAEGRWAA